MRRSSWAGSMSASSRNENRAPTWLKAGVVLVAGGVGAFVIFGTNLGPGTRSAIVSGTAILFVLIYVLVRRAGSSR